MEAPVCKICGHKHWSSQPHHVHETKAKAAGDVMVAAPAKAPKPTTPKPTLSPREKLLKVSAEKIDAEVKKRGRPRLDRPTSPRADYQRELMRKRRAKKDG